MRRYGTDTYHTVRNIQVLGTYLPVPNVTNYLSFRKYGRYRSVPTWHTVIKNYKIEKINFLHENVGRYGT